MMISGNSISTLGDLSNLGNLGNLGTLYIQNTPLSERVDFFNGQATIDNTGKLVVQEIVAKTITTEKLIIGSSPQGSNNNDGNSSSTESASGEASLGEATIPAGSLEIPVFTNAAGDKSRIFLTPLSSLKGQNLTISDIVPGSGFVVSLDQPFTTDIKFNWVILDNK